MRDRRSRAARSAAVSAVIGCLLLVPASSQARTHRHHATRHRVCRTFKLPRKHHGHRKRVRVCARKKPFHKQRQLKVRKHSGGFAPPKHPITEGNEGKTPRLPVGPFRPSGPPTQVPLAGGSAASRGRNRTASGLAIRATRLLPANAFPAGIYQPTNTLTAQEPSVASAGRVLMYAFNWDAGYSTDGGGTWKELDPHTTFSPCLPPVAQGSSRSALPPGPCNRAPQTVTFGTDQVVIYDPTTKVFIWVLQLFGTGGEDDIRVAYTTASNLASRGAHAWKYFDLPSAQIAGSGHFLDQPRLGFTDRYLYMSMNEGHGNSVFKTAIVRIPRAQFGTSQGPTGYGYAVFEPWSLRLTQNVVGATEYFVGHKDTSTLAVASIHDNSNYVYIRNVKEPTIADHNWAMTTPGGQDLLGRQSRSQSTGVTGATQDGDGNLWAAWTEGRDVVDKNGNVVTPAGSPTQPHIAVAVLHPLRPVPRHRPVPYPAYSVTRSVFWNSSYALMLPDLATDASGEVAMTYDWGGGAQYLNHAVAFLSGGFIDQTVATSTTDQSFDASNPNDNNLGNPAGDYETIRPLPPPRGDCLVAAGDVNQDTTAVPAGTGTTHVGLPVLTVFSRPGVSCPTRFPVIPPIPAPPPPPTATSLTLNCPSSASAGQPYSITGALSPPLNAASITLTYTSSSPGAPVVTHTVSTDSTGAFTDQNASPEGTETVDARYAGNGVYGPAEQTCTFPVQPFIP